MSDIERLYDYYPFSEAVVAAVNDAAEKQAGKTFQELADEYDVSDGPEHPDTPYGPLEILTLRPKLGYDDRYARVYQTPMAMPVDSMATRAMRLFAADPSAQLIVVGNPASIGNKYNKLRRGDFRTVRRGNLRPTVEPQLEYFASLGIASTDQIGYSWGADKALAASGTAATEHDIAVYKGVYIEPVSVIDRRLWRLGKDFLSARSELDKYIAACDMASVNELSDSKLLEYLDFAKYLGGLLRGSNIAIERALAGSGFNSRVLEALSSHPELSVTVAWGTSSELVPGDAISQIVGWLKMVYPKRLGSVVLDGMHHAGGDDIDLHAAIVLESLWP